MFHFCVVSIFPPKNTNPVQVSQSGELHNRCIYIYVYTYRPPIYRKGETVKTGMATTCSIIVNHSGHFTAKISNTNCELPTFLCASAANPLFVALLFAISPHLRLWWCIGRKEKTQKLWKHRIYRPVDAVYTIRRDQRNSTEVVDGRSLRVCVFAVWFPAGRWYVEIYRGGMVRGRQTPCYLLQHSRWLSWVKRLSSAIRYKKTCGEVLGRSVSRTWILFAG